MRSTHTHVGAMGDCEMPILIDDGVVLLVLMFGLLGAGLWVKNGLLLVLSDMCGMILGLLLASDQAELGVWILVLSSGIVIFILGLFGWDE